MSIKRILISTAILVGTFSAIFVAAASTYTNVPQNGSGDIVIEPTSTLSGSLDISKPNASGTWTDAFSNDGNYLEINVTGTIPGTAPVPYNIILQNCPPISTTSTQVTSSSWECALSQAENFPDGSRTFVDWDTEYYPTGTNPFIASGWFDNMRGTSSILLPFVVNFNDGSVNQTALKIYPVSSTSASKEYAQFNLGTNGQLFVGTSPTSTGAFVVNQNGGNTCAGIYDSGAATTYGFADSLPAPAGCTALGGYYHGLAIGGNSSGAGSPIFGVLNSSQSSNGKGHTGFTIYDTNEVDTFNNTLDDGNGNASVKGNLQVFGNLTDGGGNKYSTSTGSGGGASTSTSNTWTGSQTFATSTQTNVDSVIYASAQTSTIDYNAYLNNLCTNVASGTLIQLPQGKMNVSSTLSITQHCTYQGVGGNGTILNWTGAQGGTMVQENWGTLPHVEGGGLQALTLNGNSATKTNPTICLLQGGGAGGSHGINDGLTIENCGTGLGSATNTYMVVLSNSTVVGNGTNINFSSPSNSGESMDFVNVKVLDPANSSSTNCIVANANSLENATWMGGVIDDCQLSVANGNNITLEGVNFENAGYATYGAYDYISESSSFYGTVVDVYGGNMQNDSPATSTSPSEFVNVGGIYNSWGVELARSSSAAHEVSQYVNNTNNSTNGMATICNTVNQNNSGNAVVSMFPTGNTTNASNNGCLSLWQNNYVGGVDYTAGNTNFYTNGGVAMALQNGNGSLSLLKNVTLGTSGSLPGCAEMYEAGATSTLGYMYIKAGAVIATTTKPSFCQ